MVRKEKKELAKKILRMERELQQGKNVQSNMTEIEMIMNSLSIEEGLELDIYIQKLLTK